MDKKPMIATQFFDSFNQLNQNERNSATKFINLFREKPKHPSIQLKRLKLAHSKNLWSGRVNQDLRVILLKDGSRWFILYVAHHDQAYNWAEHRVIGRHSVTGAFQIVEIIEVKQPGKILPEDRHLFDDYKDDYLLSLGIPEVWLPWLRQLRNDDDFLSKGDKLPGHLAERLLALASDELVTPPMPVGTDKPAIEAADTQLVLSSFEDEEIFEAALGAPMDRWIAFLHPSQRVLVKHEFKGPSKVSGSAGTGKTVVALHRARHLAKEGNRVLLTSYGKTLCENIEGNLAKLCHSQNVLERITVSTVHSQALGIVRQAEPDANPAKKEDIEKLLDNLSAPHAPGYEESFIHAEWNNVVQTQGIASWGEYREARRTGRGKGLSVKERKVLWKVFGGALESLADKNLYDWPGLCRRAEELLKEGRASSSFTAVIVDEIQDLKPPELRFLKTLCRAHPGNLMLCGDAGQRIYSGSFNLSKLGIEVRGRSTVLRINYRTTARIRRAADQMLSETCDDMDGGSEFRTGTRSLRLGTKPRFDGCDSHNDEIEAGVITIRQWLDKGLAPEAIGAFARTKKHIEEFGKALLSENIPSHQLRDREPIKKSAVQFGTMHRAKGLEFKAVLLLGCGDKMLPYPDALRVDDPQDVETAEARERQLLYVAMTRARDELTVSWDGSPSRFLTELPKA